MGTFLDKPKTEKHNEHGGGNGLRFGVSSMQGWRVEMEDAHCAVTGLGPGLEDWSFFAVFDGHAGATVSNQCAEQLLDSIINSAEFKEDILQGIRTGFLRLDSELRQLPDLASGKDKAGSTAVCCLVSPNSIYLANCGDSRAVLCNRGKPVFATKDHKPFCPAERERIQGAGGTVLIQRVNGSLAVSRSLGDFEYKKVEGRGPCEQLVSPEPEIHVQKREEMDEFLVLACDGIWDVMTTFEVCSYVQYLMYLTDDLESIANSLIDTCLYKGSKDNMSVIIVALPGAVRPSESAVLMDKDVDATIEKKIREIMATQDCKGMNLTKLMERLSLEEIPYLPPGGGLSAKHRLIESVFKELFFVQYEDYDVNTYLSENSEALDEDETLAEQDEKI